MERPRVRVPATVQAFCILSTSTQLASIHFKGSARLVPRMDPGGPWSGVLGPDLGKPIGSAPIFRLDPSQYTLLAINRAHKYVKGCLLPPPPLFKSKPFGQKAKTILDRLQRAKRALRRLRKKTELQKVQHNFILVNQPQIAIEIDP